MIGRGGVLIVSWGYLVGEKTVGGARLEGVEDSVGGASVVLIGRKDYYPTKTTKCLSDKNISSNSSHNY